jgi:hypothetical protein
VSRASMEIVVSVSDPELAPLSRRYLTLGDGKELSERTEWGLVCRSRVNPGYDVSRVRLPTAVVIDSGANLLGVYRVTFGDSREIQFEGLVNSARLDSTGDGLLIEALGWGHVMARIHGVVKARGVEPPEVAYNVVLGAGMDPSGVQGYSPTAHRFKVTKAVKGLSAKTNDIIGGDILEPVVGSDESTMIRAMRLQDNVKPTHPLAADTLVSTGVVGPSFWEAMSFGSAELFETMALVQYQWISGDPSRLAGASASRFRPYWRTPNVSLSDPTLARQLDEAKAMTLSRAYMKRTAGRLSEGELEAAVARAAAQAKAMRALPDARRRTLRNAVHLFVRATEAREWPSALLFYSGAADEIASLAPRKRLLSRDDRRAIAAASRDLFSADDPRHQRVLEMLENANQRTFRDKLSDVAASCGVELTESTREAVGRLYEMRNLMAHVGAQPPNNIFYLFTTGLSVLDQLLSRLLAQTNDPELA